MLPWLEPQERGFRVADLARWMWERVRSGVPDRPQPEDVPTEAPRIRHPHAPPHTLVVTWLGHAGFLIQAGGLNLLTDPVLSERASPLAWAGPRRFSPAPVGVGELPPIHAVLLSHDHYDHLDLPTVRRLQRQPGGGPVWITPLGYRSWFRSKGVERVVELDWWEAHALSAPGGAVKVTAAPAQHWSRRGWRTDARLWASWAVALPDGGRLYFGGDSGYFPGYREIGRRLGPFRLLLLPIGAYEPRWFMARDHMNPEDAVLAYRDLGGQGVCMGMHWGVFQLTDEPPLEPPVRFRAAWRRAGLPERTLWDPGVGGSLVWEANREPSFVRTEGPPSNPEGEEAG